MIDLLIAFIVFIVVVAVVVLAVKWLCAQTGVPGPIAQVLLWVIGAVALIIFLVRFVKPLAHA
jgi:hypothetical protein